MSNKRIFDVASGRFVVVTGKEYRRLKRGGPSIIDRIAHSIAQTTKGSQS